MGLFLFIKFKEKNYYKIPTYANNNTVNAIIEIPAGTNHKIEYKPYVNKFINDTENEEERIIDFLPYPANYGFIPSTMMDTARGGDGDALDIIVIGEYLEMKSIIEVIPIAVLQLSDRGETDDKIVAVPADNDLQIISATTFNELKQNYPKILEILKTWFTSYKGVGKMKFNGWLDEKSAVKEIDYWKI